VALPRGFGTADAVALLRALLGFRAGALKALGHRGQALVMEFPRRWCALLFLPIGSEEVLGGSGEKESPRSALG
jgi:hypothetical protein